jgi:hypothetical protein
MEVVPVRDLDADAIPDLIVGSWDSNVHVLSGADGSSLWNAAVGQDVWMVDTLADVTGDGRPEVVAGALNGHIVRLFDGATGSPLWQYGFSERVYDVTGAPDLNGDSHPDVLVGLQDQANQADHIYCLDGNPPSGVEELPDRTRPVLSFDPVGRVVRCPPGPGTEFRLDIFDPAGRRAAGPFRATGDAALCLPPLPAGPYVAVLSRSRAAPVAFRVLLYPRP